jgi:predicted DNA-binding transcriptional regulator AlpA
MIRQQYKNILNKRDAIALRDRIMDSCGITLPTFYKWVANDQVPDRYAAHVESVFQEYYHNLLQANGTE